MVRYVDKYGVMVKSRWITVSGKKYYFDKTGKARFGCLRGISEGRFHGDLSGSDKHYSFALPACGKNPAVHLCECAIDVMSYATLCKLDGIDWRRHNLLSLAGIYQPKKVLAESKLDENENVVYFVNGEAADEDAFTAVINAQNEKADATFVPATAENLALYLTIE